MAATTAGDMTIVDACTYRGRGGSPTAVLIDDHTLDDDARRAVVRDAGTSHAAFVDTAERHEPGVIAADDAPSVASPGTPRLLVPLKTGPALHALRPDLLRLAGECRRRGYLGCFVYATSPDRDKAIARMFAPAIGVGEDVVNANSTGCLAAHLHATHGRNRIEVEQGHPTGRPSLVLATATATTAGISTRIGGTAVIRRSAGTR